MSNIIGIEHDRVTNTTATDFPGFSANAENAWDLEEFKKKFQLNISYITDRTANFDLIGLDSSIANAFRRIMIAEVPSVAAEYVYVFNNTSVIQDEVLAQRIGMIPLKVDPDMLTWIDPNAEEKDKFTDENTVVLSLDVMCSKNPNAIPNNNDPENLYRNSNVYAKDLKFEPQGKQSTQFAKCPVIPCDPDILLAKLRPGQEIALRVHCILGIGSDHSKFSPVSTASYRLLPTIDILKPITGQDAFDFQKCFPSGVIDVENDQAIVKDTRKDTVSREVLRHEKFNGKVKLGRVRDHFIFNVESTGAMSPEEIFFKSVRVLRNKANYLRSCPLGNLN